MPSGESPRTEDASDPSPASSTQLLPTPIPAGPNDVTMVGGAHVATTSTPLPSDRFPKIPGYSVVCELGRGGMGIVYRANQDRLNRTVAVKMLLHHDAADPSDVVRFRSEAEAVAAIIHPHVVKVFESGYHEGRSYFAMEYLPGGTLHAKLRAKAPFTPDDAAALVEKLARAVHAAHTIGIVHRDIKPGNVLFDAAGEPRVTDFGLAKRSSQELTRTQAVMGTPAYMPPEQAAGRAKYVGPPADIYALGVILYECLSGRTPFSCEDSLQLLNQVIADDPPSIRSKTPTVPRDLELICFKCLEKGPTDRYQTAAELADDLQRYINREPVSVRPAGVIEKAVKWAKRRPTLAAAYGLGALVAVLLIFGGGAAVLAVQAAWARDDAARHWLISEQARAQLQQQTEELERAKGEEERHRKAAERARDELDIKNQLVSQLFDREKAARVEADKARQELRTARYFRSVSFAHQEARDGNFLRAITLLDDCPEADRGWEWWHAYRVAHTEAGSGVVTGGFLPLDVAFGGPGGDVTTSHVDATIVAFNFEKREGQPIKLGPHRSSVGLSADGRRAVVVRPWDAAHDDGVSVWDTTTRNQIAAFRTPKEACGVYALSPDGKRVVFQYRSEPLRAYEVETGKELGRLDCPLDLFTRPRLSADGKTGIASTGKAGVVWTVDGGAEERRVRCEDGDLAAVGLSPDGKTAVTGSNTGELRFHPAGGREVTVRRAHVGAISTVAFTADGGRAATAGEDGVVRVWDQATGGLVRQFHGHMRPVTALAFNPAGTRLVSCDASAVFKVWPLDSVVSPVAALPAGPRMKKAFAATADLSRMFASDADDWGAEWKVKANTEHPLLAPKGGTFTAAAFNPASEQKAVGTAAGQVFTQADSGANPSQLLQLAGAVRILRYSADGKRLLAASAGQVVVWDFAAEKMAHAEQVGSAGMVATLSDDGRWLAVRYAKEEVDVIEVGGKKRYPYWTGRDVSALAFTPDASELAIGYREWGVTLHPTVPDQDGRLSRPVREYVGHTAPVTSIGFNRGGTRLVSGAADGAVRVWDKKGGYEAIGLSVGSKVPVTGVWFTPTGDELVALPENGPPVLFSGATRELALRHSNSNGPPPK